MSDEAICHPCADIVTLTRNPAVDVSYEFVQLPVDQKTHATSTRFDPGGNGINVARALKELFVCAHSCCVVAGHIGRLLQTLLRHSLDDPHCIEVIGETRINAALLQQEPAVQYEVTGQGPLLSAIALQDVRSTVGAGDSMVAGLVAAFAQDQRPEEALRLAVACGSATAAQPGTGLFAHNDLDPLLRQIEVESLAL